MNPAKSIAFAGLLIVLGPTVGANEVSNPEFDVDTTGWEDPFPDVNTEIAWNGAENFSGAVGSGSLELRNSIDNGAADGPAQCIPALPQAYGATARGLIPSSQILIPVAILILNYYGTTDCSGGSLDSDAAFIDATDSWEVAEINGVAPAGTQSIEVRLLSGNTVDPTFTTAYWDAIFVPEPRGAALAAGAGLALYAQRRRHAPVRGSR